MTVSYLKQADFKDELKGFGKSLAEKLVDPGGVHLREAGGGTDGGVAQEDAAGVLVHVEAHVHHLHLAVQGDGHNQFIIGPFHAEEFEGGGG